MPALKDRGSVSSANLSHWVRLALTGAESPPCAGLCIRNLGLCFLRASDVSKLCRIQGKSLLGQSRCSDPSGSFQVCVGSTSISFVGEALKLAQGQCLFTLSMWLVENSKFRLLQREDQLLSLVVLREEAGRRLERRPVWSQAHRVGV